MTIELFWVACSQNGTEYRRLAEADTLLYHSFVETADSLLIEINPQNEEDSAYYFLLRAQTDFRLHDVPNINQLNYSIAYYEKHPDSRKLADSYYYKVCYFTSFDSLPNEVFVMIKKAEKLAENTFDDNLKNKICTALCCVNNIMGETEEALKYANREYYYAQRLNSRRDMAYALIKLAVLHKNSNHADSCDYYTKQCIFLADEVDEQDKSFIYNLLGDCFFEIDPIAAEVYYNKALSYKKIPESFKSLADIYFEKNDTLRWRQYCDSALSYAWNELKVTIFSDMAQKYFEFGNIIVLKKYSDETVATLKEYYNSERDNYALEIQKKFDYKHQQIVYEHKMHILWIVIACLIFISAIIVLIYRHLVHKERLKSLELEKQNMVAYTKIEERNSLLDEYTSQLVFMKKQNDELSERCNDADKIIATNNQAIDKLRQVCDNYLHQDDSIISKIFCITKSTVRSRRTKMKIKID